MVAKVAERKLSWRPSKIAALNRVFRRDMIWPPPVHELLGYQENIILWVWSVQKVFRFDQFGRGTVLLSIDNIASVMTVIDHAASPDGSFPLQAAFSRFTREADPCHAAILDNA